jgi:hypothetical protein
MPEVTLVEAINLSLARAMEDDPNVVVFGEDVGVNGGVFRETVGLQKRFGSERVFDTPLAELLISGLCVGMAGHRTRRPHHTGRRRGGRQKSRRRRSGRGIARDATRHGPAHGSGACRSRPRYCHRRR